MLWFAAAHLGTAARDQAVVVARERSVHTLDCRGPAIGTCVADTGYRHVCNDRGQGSQQGWSQLWTVGPLTVSVYFCDRRILLQGIQMHTEQC